MLQDNLTIHKIQILKKLKSQIAQFGQKSGLKDVAGEAKLKSKLKNNKLNFSKK